MAKRKRKIDEAAVPAVTEARRLGAVAFTAGLGRTPALNPAVLKLIGANPGPGNAIAILDGYLAGWDRANLDAPVVLADGTSFICSLKA